MRVRSKRVQRRHQQRRRPGAAEAVVRLEGRTLMSSVTPAVARGYVPPPKLVAARVTLSPAATSLADGTSFQYAATAYDQNGNVLAVTPSMAWSTVAGGAGGAVGPTGMFTAPATGAGTTTVQVAAGTARATVAVNVTAAGVLTGDADVGSPALAGHYSYTGTTYSVSGDGSDIWNTSDQFNFASTTLTGDGVVEARVTSVGNTDPWAKAGVMFRDSAVGTSRDVYVNVTPAGVVQLNERATAGGAATTVGASPAGVASPTWVKLVRDGNSFTGYYGTDGTTWTQLGAATTVPLNATASAGLAVTSHTTTSLNTSTFDNVQVISQPATGVYRLAIQAQPGLSLDITGFANADETSVALYTADYTSNQQWLVQEQGDGTYKVYAYSGANSLQMLDLTNGSTANGNLVNTYADNGNSAQRWIFIPEGGGYYRIEPKNGENTSATLDVQNGASAALGSRTDIFTYAGGGNQLFALDAPGTLQVLPNPKKGVAGYSNEATAVHAAWGYDWGSGGSEPAGVEYDPMVWGYYGNANNGFANWMSTIASTGAKYVMGLNEPDNASQANSTVANALEAWGYMQNAGLPLVSPAAVDATDSWMQQFMSGAAAKGYRVDAVAIHWYGGDDPTGFINYVNQVHNLYGKPVWITEFCPADWSGNGGVTAAEAASFMQAVIPQLNAMSFVQRYSWFSAGTTDADLGQGALYNADGSLTALGTLYSRL